MKMDRGVRAEGKSEEEEDLEAYVGSRRRIASKRKKARKRTGKVTEEGRLKRERRQKIMDDSRFKEERDTDDHRRDSL